MVKRRPESTGGKQVTGRELTQFKPGQSGNPKGRPQGSRNKLSEEFLADVHASWQRLRPAGADDRGDHRSGRASCAWLHRLMPSELEATTTPVTERMSDAQLEAIIARGIEGGLDPAAPDEDAQIIQ